MSERKSLARLQPLFIGRLARVLFGIGTLYFAFTLTLDWVWLAVLIFLGVSFLLGGLMGHPGCEVMVLPNLLVRPENRSYSV